MGDKSNALAGTAFLQIGSRNYMIAGKATYTVSGEDREPVIGMRGFAGYSHKAVPGRISMQMRDDGTLRLADIQAMTDVNVHLELINGKQVSGQSMFVTKALELNTEDATFDVEFIGERVEELSTPPSPA